MLKEIKKLSKIKGNIVYVSELLNDVIYSYKDDKYRYVIYVPDRRDLLLNADCEHLTRIDLNDETVVIISIQYFFKQLMKNDLDALLLLFSMFNSKYVYHMDTKFKNVMFNNYSLFLHKDRLLKFKETYMKKEETVFYSYIVKELVSTNYIKFPLKPISFVKNLNMNNDSIVDKLLETNYDNIDKFLFKSKLPKEIPSYNIRKIENLILEKFYK